jgi:hypothetical protein
MNPAIIELSEKIKALEGDLEVQLALARADLRLSFEGGKVEFEQEVLRRHREMKTSLMHYVMGARLLILLTAPIIYILIIPLALLDIFITIYQAICFPVYGISKVRRADYLIFDRRYLAYLNALEKLNCAYCSYANGLIGYVREIASRTEAYWCPIKHARKVVGAHPRYSQFADFGDAKEYKREINEINEQLRKKKSEAT